jgi:hypothetical protein
MSADFIETFNQGNHPMDTVSLDNIKGGSMAGRINVVAQTQAAT